MRLLVIAALFSAVHALPSCDAETDANCVGEDADLSPEGINACLAALAEKSDDCKTYLALMEACTADLSDGGICFAAKMDGEAIPCLVQRVQPEQLSEACKTGSWRVLNEELRRIPGFGGSGFMAKEVALPALHAPRLRCDSPRT